MRTGSLSVLCILGVLIPRLGGAAPLLPIILMDSSLAQAHETGSPRLPDAHIAFNDCIGNPLVCESEPTAAMQSLLRTSANAFTDGFGGSGLSLRSRDGHVDADARTLEDGLFEVTGHDPVDVRVQGFFPAISLAGIFAPGSELAYDILVVLDAQMLFHTHGLLTSAGFTATGDDVGAIYNAHDHTVSVPAFFFDRTVAEVGQFGLTVTESLSFTSTDWVEIADARMADPEDVSAPGIVRNGVSAVVTDVPEPGSIALMGIAAAYVARRRRSVTRRTLDATPPLS